MGGAARRRCGRRRGAVHNGGHGAGGVLGARRPSGHDTVAERHHGGAAGADRCVPPTGKTDPAAAARRCEPVPGAGRAALRGRPPTAQARVGRTARVPVHGRPERHAPIRRVPVERACVHRPNGIANEGNTGG